MPPISKIAAKVGFTITAYSGVKKRRSTPGSGARKFKVACTHCAFYIDGAWAFVVASKSFRPACLWCITHHVA